MTDVVVLGEPVHARRIVRTLNRCRPEVTARFVPSPGYPALLLAGRGRPPDVVVRAGFRAGASTPRGRLFDRYWALLRRAMPDARACHVWLGTDVLRTRREVAAGTIDRRCLDAVRGDLHLAVAPWLADELAGIGIRAETALLPPEHPLPPSAPPMPPELRVLTYLPAPRFAFYGGPAVLEAARVLPDVAFDVVGAAEPAGRRSRDGRGDPGTDPPNVRRLGWVRDMPARYAEATVVVRVPEHDGFGNTVIEALGHARHVVYTHPLPGVRAIPAGDAGALVAALADLREQHHAGRLGPNLEGRAWAVATFDPDLLADRLVALLRPGDAR